MEIRARETARVSFGSANPVMVTVAAPFVEPLLMAAQVCGSGFQVCAAACFRREGGRHSAHAARIDLADFETLAAGLHLQNSPAPPANFTSIFPMRSAGFGVAP